jgi:hypothetical protein
VSRDEPADQPSEDESVGLSGERSEASDGAPGSTEPEVADLEEGPEQAEIHRVSYDCSPWAGETRRLLAGMLTNQRIPHVWEGTVLVVRRQDEAGVDLLVEEVAATAVDVLDPDLPVVAYEVSVLPSSTQNEVVQALAAEGIPHEWDADGDLVIHEADAPRLEELLEELAVETSAGAETDEADLDGIELHDRLTALFVAADRLAHDPSDWRAGLGLLDADEALDGVGVPFGFDRSTWQEVLDGSADLVAALAEAAERGGPLHERAPTGDDPTDGLGGRDHGGDEHGERAATGSGEASGLAALGGVPVLGGRASRVDGTAVDGTAVDGTAGRPSGTDRSRSDVDASVQAQARRLRDLLRRML